jgi:tetratricopeptide (TPR) repeat protein
LGADVFLTRAVYSIVILWVALLSTSGCGTKNPTAHVSVNEAAEVGKRGVALLDAKQYDQAIREFDEGIRLDPNSPSLFTARGLAWFGMGNVDRALADFDEAIRLDPRYARAYYERGSLRRTMGQLDAALRDLDEAVRLDPEYPPALNNRGIARHKAGDSARAIADFDEAIRLDPKFTDALENRGWIRYELGDVAKSLADVDEAIRLKPDGPAAYRWRGWVRATANDPAFRNGALAVADATRACELTSWQNPEYFPALAAAYAENGQFDEAVRWQMKSLCDDLPEGVKSGLRERLALFKARKPYRVGMQSTFK